jgi:hypothetical protein
VGALAEVLLMEGAVDGVAGVVGLAVAVEVTELVVVAVAGLAAAEASLQLMALCQ